MTFRTRLLFIMLAAACFGAGPAMAQSRSAAFLDPASASSGSSGGTGKGAAVTNTVTADPAQTDAGETLVNVARRVTVFFYNGFRAQVALNELTMNADGNVRSKVLSDDCRALKILPSQARCSIVLEIVPSSPGPWSVELLLNHSGQGRIARAEVVGSTLGKTDEKAEGLAVSKKISAAIDFGNVHAREETAVRTMLIENDSTEPLKISSVDLIAHDEQGLKLRENGCQKGDELKPGESCPISIIWQPKSRGNIATDLIVHHSGSLGFVVVPIRGASEGSKGDSKSAQGDERDDEKPTLIPPSKGEQRAMQPSLPTAPPSLDQIARSLPTIDSGKLKKASAKNKGDDSGKEKTETEIPEISLIGTVNGRAILSDRDGQSYVVGLGETTAIGDVQVSLLQLDSTRAVLNIMGRRKEIHLRRAPTFMQTEKSGKGGSIGVDGGSGSGLELGGSGGGSSSGGLGNMSGGASASPSPSSSAPPPPAASTLGYSPTSSAPASPTAPSAPLGSTMGLDTPGASSPGLPKS